MEEQHRLAVRPDAGLAVAEHPRAAGDEAGSELHDNSRASSTSPGSSDMIPVTTNVTATSVGRATVSLRTM